MFCDDCKHLFNLFSIIKLHINFAGHIEVLLFLKFVHSNYHEDLHDSCKILCEWEHCKGLTPSQKNPIFSVFLKMTALETRMMCEKENADNLHFTLFPHLYHRTTKLIHTFGSLNICCFCEELNFYHIIPTFNDPEVEAFVKHCGKRRRCW